jgi:hypothetical protein
MTVMDFKPLTPEELVSLGSGLSRESWIYTAEKIATDLRIAVAILGQTRDELVEAVLCHKPGSHRLEDLEDTAELLRNLSALIEKAHGRQIAAISEAAREVRRQKIVPFPRPPAEVGRGNGNSDDADVVQNSSL